MEGISRFTFIKHARRKPVTSSLNVTFYNEAGSSVITAMPALRVRINNGAWQTLSAAGLTVSQPSPGKIEVSGFTGTETSVEYHYEHEWPGEPYNLENSVSGIYARTGNAFVNIAGMPLTPTRYEYPIGATA